VQVPSLGNGSYPALIQAFPSQHFWFSIGSSGGGGWYAFQQDGGTSYNPAHHLTPVADFFFDIRQKFCQGCFSALIKF